MFHRIAKNIEDRPEYLAELLGCCFIFPILFCWSRYLNRVGDWLIPATLAFGIIAITNLGTLDRLLMQGGRKLRLGHLFVLITCGFVSSGLMHYWAFSLNAHDFSMFDTALHNTGEGRFMFNAINNDYVFATHSFFVLIPLALLHTIFSSPYLLIVTHALTIAGSAVCLFFLARKYLPSDFFAVIAVWAYVFSPWVGRIANYGFHPEVFYLLFGFLFALGWMSKNHRLWILPYVGYLCIKEDAALYMLMFGLGVLLLCREHRGVGIAISLASLVFFWVNTVFIIPHYQSMNSLPMPASSRFWAEEADASMADVAVYLIQRPWPIIKDILTSKWPALLAPLLLLPLFSRTTALPTLGIIALLGSSKSDLMRGYLVYYSAPLLPFVFWGLLEASTSILKLVPAKYRVIGWRSLCAIMLLFPLFSGGSLKYPQPDFQGVVDVNQAINILLSNPPIQVLAQGAIIPHLPYSVDYIVLSRQSVDINAGYLLANPGWDPYPEDQKWIANVIDSRDQWPSAQQKRSGLVILSK